MVWILDGFCFSIIRNSFRTETGEESVLCQKKGDKKVLKFKLYFVYQRNSEFTRGKRITIIPLMFWRN